MLKGLRASVVPLLPRKLRNAVSINRTRDAWQALGWVRSNEEKMCVDRHGKPLPWYTYPAIHFLETRSLANLDVLEFGMGNSTLWWAAHARTVVTCESDAGWFGKISPAMPANVTARLHAADSPEYVSAAQGLQFDVLVLDGRRRVECLKHSLPGLRSNGVVVWDNADRERYREGYDLLATQGFRRLDFAGFGPLGKMPWQTAIFYRRDNCLEI